MCLLLLCSYSLARLLGSYHCPGEPIEDMAARMRREAGHISWAFIDKRRNSLNNLLYRVFHAKVG